MNKNLLSKNKIIVEKLFCYIILFMITIIICVNFTTSPFSKLLPFADSPSFIEIGNLIKNGKIIYKDMFDHKGPFMYFIQYIGVSISNGFTGIWILEIISMFVFVCFFYKTAHLWISSVFSMVCLIFTISLLPYYLGWGNYTEEFALPLVAVSLYIFSTYFKDKKYNISSLQLFILGVCFGLAIMLRPNTAALWPSFCLIILIHLIVRKDYKLLFKFTTLFLSGLLVVVGIVLFYMIKNDALTDFIDSYLIFNFKYSITSNWNRFNTFMKFVDNEQFYISIVGYIAMIIFIKKIESEKLLYYIASFVFFVVSFLFTVMSGVAYQHYCMQLVPVYLIPITYVFLYIEDFFKNIKEYRIFPTIIIAVLAVIVIYNFKSDTSILNTTLDSTRSLRSTSSDDKENRIPIANRIIEKTSPDDKIIVYNTLSIIYILANREPASKYFYQPLWTANTGIGKKFIEDIKNNKPKAIVLSSKDILNKGGGEYEYVNQELTSILEADYKLDLETDTLMLYIKN